MNGIKNFFAASLTAIFFCTGCGGTEATEPEKIPTEKVLAVDTTKNFQQDLIIYTSPAKYSYENFMHDVDILRTTYPSQVQVLKLCNTPDGREVVDIVLGDLNGNQSDFNFRSNARPRIYHYASCHAPIMRDVSRAQR